MPEKPHNFWQELKRRKVVRVIVMYAGAAYIILELVNNIIGPLHLPEWIATLVILLLIIGFPIIAILSWIFDITPAGIRKTDAETIEEGHKTKRRKLQVSDIIITVLLVAVIILIYPKIFKRDKLEQLKSQDQITIAVMPFQNMTGDTTWNIWQGGIQDELISYLTNAEELKVRQTATINNILQDKDPVNWASITPSLASNISITLNADIFIYGTIKQAGEKIRVNAHLAESKTEENLKSFTVEDQAREEMIFPIIDSLKRKVSDFLIINKLLSVERDPYLKAYHSSSPEAYRYFIYGLNAFQKEDYPSARNLLHQALEADSNYIQAAFHITASYSNQGLYQEAKKWCLKIYSKRDFMPVQLKLVTDIVYAEFFETPEEQILCWKQILTIDDHQHAYLYMLGQAYCKLYQYDKAIPAFEKAIEVCDKLDIKPFWAYYYTALGEAYHETGEYRKENKLYKRAEKDFPGDPLLLYRQAILALSKGNTSAANKYIDKYISIPEEKLVSLGYQEVNLGTLYWESEIFDEAEEYYRNAVNLEPQDISKLNDLAYFLIDSERNVTEGLELAEKELEMDPDNYNYLHAKGWGLYKKGNYREALNVLQKSWDLRKENAIYDHQAFLHLEAAKKAVADQNSEH